MLNFSVVTPEEIYKSRVATKRTLYLDHNIWIDFADGKTTEALEALELARLGVKAGLLVCPVSYPALTELLKQGRNPSSIKQAHVMDDLARGVTMRAERHVIDEEVKCAYDYFAHDKVTRARNQMFTHVVCYLGDGRIEFPDGWNVPDAASMMDTFRRNLPGVTWLLEHLPVEDFQKRHAAGDVRYVEKVSSLNSDLSEFVDRSGKLNHHALRLEEHKYVFKNYFLERLPRLVGAEGMIRGLASFQSRKVKPGPPALARLIDKMPSTALSCELHVQRRLAGRKPRPQDLYDQEHAVLGVPYCDVFATNDGELFDLLRKAKATQKHGTVILRGISKLKVYLDRLLDSVTVSV